MAFDMSILTGMFSIVGPLVIFLIIGVVVLGVIIGSLLIRRKRKYVYSILEFTDLGGGKMGIKEFLGGWFKSKHLFNHLWELGGEDRLILKDGREVQQVSSDDFHELFGKRGIVCARKGDDPRVLLPIARMEITNKNLMMEIAPADYRDTSAKLMESAKNETLSKLEKYAPYIIFGFLGVLFLVTVIIVYQMIKSGQSSAADLILEAGKLVANARPSGAP